MKQSDCFNILEENPKLYFTSPINNEKTIQFQGKVENGKWCGWPSTMTLNELKETHGKMKLFFMKET